MGLFGIEAMSRGAKTATFCDNSKEAIRVIETNLKNTKCIENTTIINKDYILALRYLAKENKNFDIIFLDPPYKTEFANEAIQEIIKLQLLSKDGIIILETDDTEKEKKIMQNEIKIFDKRKYGRAILIFIRKE